MDAEPKMKLCPSSTLPGRLRDVWCFVVYFDLQTEMEAVGLNEVNKRRLNAAKCSLPPPNLGEFPLFSNEVNRSVWASFLTSQLR